MDKSLDERPDSIPGRLALSAMPGRSPVVVFSDASIRDALETMDNHRVGSIVVVEQNGLKPVGILTLQDVLRRVALPGLDTSGSVVTVMTRQVESLQQSASAYEGLLFMTHRRIRHVPVVNDNGNLVSVVSLNQLRDPFSGAVDLIMRRVDDAAHIDELAGLAGEARELCMQLLGKHGDSGMLASVLTALNDGLSRRIIDLAVRQFGVPPNSWCWIVMGSEGRFEQTFLTDQDNGLIFSAANDREADELRRIFLPMARQVNRDLDRCGIPHCSGGIMAGTPDCCLSLDEWKQRFQSWIRTPDPQALLNATIFFDYRPLYGDDYLAKDLRDHLLALTRDQSVFFRFMANNALAAEAPIGILREFVTERGPGNTKHIDLKKFGSRLFVDAARIFALAAGSAETNTVERLRSGGPSSGIHASDIDSAVQALAQLQRIRMVNQTKASVKSNGNLLQPQNLNRLDRKILRESLWQAQSLQSNLRLMYAI